MLQRDVAGDFICISFKILLEINVIFRYYLLSMFCLAKPLFFLHSKQDHLLTKKRVENFTIKF